MAPMGLVANLESRSFNVEFDGDGRSGIYTCRDGGYSSIPGQARDDNHETHTLFGG
jgi:hypothetical protein